MDAAVAMKHRGRRCSETKSGRKSHRRGDGNKKPERSFPIQKFPPEPRKRVLSTIPLPRSQVVVTDGSFASESASESSSSSSSSTESSSESSESPESSSNDEEEEEEEEEEKISKTEEELSVIILEADRAPLPPPLPPPPLPAPPLPIEAPPPLPMEAHPSLAQQKMQLQRQQQQQAHVFAQAMAAQAISLNEKSSSLMQPNTPKAPNQHWSLDYSSHYVVTGERPQNWIVEPNGIPTPALQKLVNLKSELISAHAHVPLSVRINDARTYALSSHTLGVFDVIIINPDWSKMSWQDVADLDINSVTSEKAFVFLWTGKGDGQSNENALKILEAWNLQRQAEEIVWVKTGIDNYASKASGIAKTPPSSPARAKNYVSSPSSPTTPSSATSRSRSKTSSPYSSPSSFSSSSYQSTSIASTISNLSMVYEKEKEENDACFSLHKEHCIIAAKNKVSRKESQIIHSNIDADVIISPPLEGNRKPDQIYAIAERFVQGLRRLNLFGDPATSANDLREGWVTVSENVNRTTHNPVMYKKAFEGLRQGGSFETTQYERRGPPALHTNRTGQSAHHQMVQPPQPPQEQQQQHYHYHQFENNQQLNQYSNENQRQQQQQRNPPLPDGKKYYKYQEQQQKSPPQPPSSSPQRISRPAHLMPHNDDITRLRPKSRSPPPKSHSSPHFQAGFDEYNLGITSIYPTQQQTVYYQQQLFEQQVYEQYPRDLSRPPAA